MATTCPTRWISTEREYLQSFTCCVGARKAFSRRSRRPAQARRRHLRGSARVRRGDPVLKRARDYALHPPATSGANGEGLHLTLRLVVERAPRLSRHDPRLHERTGHGIRYHQLTSDRARDPRIGFGVAERFGTWLVACGSSVRSPAAPPPAAAQPSSAGCTATRPAVAHHGECSPSNRFLRMRRRPARRRRTSPRGTRRWSSRRRTDPVQAIAAPGLARGPATTE